ncbi:MAG: PAS domain S-box protein [Candidatus Hydrogenedentes bacterium]|nr:PAS domain S-box protein [Candidatus Hydrogenedentota bacterium]
MSAPETRTAVLIHDDPVQTEVLSKLLEEEGLKVRVFSDAEKAYLACTGKVPPAIIVSGLHLPDIDGLRFCRLLRSPMSGVPGDVPILLAAATISPEETGRLAANAGANAYLPLPAEARDHSETLHALLHLTPLPHARRVLLIVTTHTDDTSRQRAFEAAGFRVDVALGFQKARERFEGGVYELALLDVPPAVYPCGELLMQLRALRPEAALVMMLDAPEPRDILAFMQQGAAACVPNPCPPDGLVRYCEDVLQERAWVRMEAQMRDKTRELRESNDRYTALFEGARDAILIAEPESGLILQANREAERLMGRPLMELIGLHYSQLHPKEGEERRQEAFERHATMEAGQPMETEILRADGTVVPVEVSGSVVNLGGGRRVVQGLFRDISKRREAEAALAEQVSRQRLQFERSKDGIVVLNRQGGVSDLNQRFADMLGYPLEEARALHVWDWDARWTKEELTSKVLFDPEITFETRHRRKDGSIYEVEVSTILAQWGGQMLRYCVCRDITQRKETEARLRETLTLLDTVFDSASDALLAVDAHGGVLRINRRFRELWNVPGEIGNERGSELIVSVLSPHLEDAGPFARMVEYLETKPEAEYIGSFELRDGRIIESQSWSHVAEQGMTCRVWSFHEVVLPARVQKRPRKSTLHPGSIEGSVQRRDT